MRVPDDEPCEVSHERQLRMVASLTETLERNVMFCGHDEALACARNIAAAYPVLGMEDDEETRELTRRLGEERGSAGPEEVRR